MCIRDSLDGMWANGYELWDVAAGLLIAQESGALISNFNGDPKYQDSDHFICSSPKVYKSILKSVKPYFNSLGNSSNSAPSGSGTAKSS